MPATEETYRKQPTLHVVFALSSVAMLLSIVWMIMADHLRPWKEVQREFQQIEEAKLKAAEAAKLDEQKAKSQTRLDQIAAEINEAEAARASNRSQYLRKDEARIKAAGGAFESIDTKKKFKKAELDSKRSEYDLLIDRDEERTARGFLSNVIVPVEKEFFQLSKKYEEASRRLREAKLARDVHSSKYVAVMDAPPAKSPAYAAGFRKGDRVPSEHYLAFHELVAVSLGRNEVPVTKDDLTALRGRLETEFEEVKKDNAQSERARILVARIEEIDRRLNGALYVGAPGGENEPRLTAPGVVTVPVVRDDKEFVLPVEVALKDVPAGMEADDYLAEIGLKPTPQTVEVLTKQREDIERDAARIARTIEQKDRLHGGSLHWYSKPMAIARGLPGIDLMPPTKIQQISLPELTINYNFKEVPRYDRCTTCHQGIDRIGYDVDAQGKSMKKSHPAFASHPYLTDGATAIDPKGKVVPAGLYLAGDGPHPINSFGCTICHGGQGSGTDFTYSSHEPNDLEQREHWEHKHGWREMHHWDEPMLPARFLQSSCLKCHHQVTDVPQAKKLQAGYERIARFGCTGCHTIGGEGSFGPDLTDEPQVGPNLAHVASKVSKEWVLKWIKNPHAFRPDSRMPRFYGVTNNNDPKDWPKSHAEIHAITTYLFARSKPPAEFADVPAKGDPKQGKTLFLQKGCMACHSHRPYAPGEIQPQDVKEAHSKYKPDPAATYDPANFPESVRKYAKADYGPNLSNIAAKFQKPDQGYKWLANWIKAPETYHPKSLMPNLQLSAQDAADIAAWILSVPGEWPVAVEVPAVDSAEVKKGIDELVALYVAKGGFTSNGKHTTVPLSEVKRFVKDDLKTDEKLMFLGEKTIGRLGCFGCHNIPGFENAKPIGTPLNGWGFKSPSKLDFGHIAEYVQDQPTDDDGSRDGTDPYFQEKLAEHTRSGFLYQKLHRPRSYDYKKTNDDLKAWDDRLRMPQFSFANDPAAVQEVMTFVLGLTGEKINAKYLAKTKNTPGETAVAQGAKLLNRHNCTGCHVIQMPRYTVAVDAAIDDALPGLKNMAASSYNARANDYLKEFYPDLGYDPKKTPDLSASEDKSFVVEGMPIGLIEDDLTVQLWRPVKIRGYTFNVGDNLTLNQKLVDKTDAEGGDFAWLYSTSEAERTGSDFGNFWNRLPPPLVREGLKVQTPWVTAFLKDPYPIRPAANLRMPRFHYGRSEKDASQETTSLANYFAARDGAEFPYQAIPQRAQGYLSSAEKAHPNYIGAGWQIMTKGACIQCHAIGQYKPTGGASVVNGPDLRQVAPRFRPGYLEEWLANPKRLVPYTAMPQNVPPHAAPTASAPGSPPPSIPKTFEDKPLDMVKAMRDTLLNYVDAVESQLAGGKTEPEKPAAAAKPGASE